MQTLAQHLAAFLRSDIEERLTPAVRATIKVAFLDTAGCILSGRDEPVTQITAQWIERRYKVDKESTVLFGDTQHSALAAAMLAAVSGHALDFDDVALAGHPSVVLVPALLAEAERSKLSALAIISAYAKGYQVWAELLDRLPESLHEKGWHPTAVLGTISVAAAISAARGLTMMETTHALGIAASRASGLVANFGSMTKPLHAGWAVEQGISSVELAEAGITAAPDALDGPTGLLTALSSTVPPERSRSLRMDKSLAIAKVRPSVKKYPVCYASHRVIDGVLRLRKDHDLALADIVQIKAYVSTTNAKVLKYPRPCNALEAKFSMQFACACALVFGDVNLEHLSESALAHPEVQRLMNSVEVIAVDTQCPLEPSFALHDRVLITLSTENTLDSGPIRYALGHAELPLTASQVEAKVLACVPPHEIEKARALILRLRSLLN